MSLLKLNSTVVRLAAHNYTEGMYSIYMVRLMIAIHNGIVLTRPNVQRISWTTKFKRPLFLLLSSCMNSLCTPIQHQRLEAHPA